MMNVALWNERSGSEHHQRMLQAASNIVVRKMENMVSIFMMSHNNLQNVIRYCLFITLQYLHEEAFIPFL